MPANSNREADPSRDRALSSGTIPAELIHEGDRVFRLCNACRYCEGFCAVFPAMERRLNFVEQDINYLANLCHNCGECYYACPYTPPHEFALNLPRTLAEIRLATYRKYAWPGLFGDLFRRNGLTAAAAMVAAPLLFLAAIFVVAQPGAIFLSHPDAEGAFYAVLSHGAMTQAFLAASLFVLAALVIGVVRFWRDTRGGTTTPMTLDAMGEALGDALRLRYLEGGGEGCSAQEETPSHARRWLHHLTFYGFCLCFAATSVAAIYHYVFGWEAPYPFLSAPVLLGTAGGVGLLLGPSGLLWLKSSRNPETSDPKQSGMDVAFLALLFLTSLTGLLLLVLRQTSSMGIVLAVHLGMVMALFVTMPYGKFVHATYRMAALARNAIEKRRQTPGAGGG